MENTRNLENEWDPQYPTAAALAYKSAFVHGAAVGGLREIPSGVLSWAIDRAIGAGTPAMTAGRVFSDVYFRVAQRREPRGGYGSPTAYLLAAYEKELQSGI